MCLLSWTFANRAVAGARVTVVLVAGAGVATGVAALLVTAGRASRGLVVVAGGLDQLKDDVGMLYTHHLGRSGGTRDLF